MKLLGIVCILLFLTLPVSATILNLLSSYFFSPLISQTRCYFNNFVNPFILIGLMCIAFQVILVHILHQSSSRLSSDKDYDDYNMNYEVCLEGRLEVNSKKSDALFDHKTIDVEGFDLDENPAGLHEMKKEDAQQKTCSIGCSCEKDDDGCVETSNEEDVGTLERRIEEFIARSYSRWKEEKINIPLSVNDSCSYYLENEFSEEAQQIEIMARPKNAININKKLKRHHSHSHSIPSLILKKIKLPSHKPYLTYLYSNAAELHLSSGMNWGK